jgi:hypothetical protein
LAAGLDCSNTWLTSTDVNANFASGVVACRRAQTPYQIRNIDGRPINTYEARAIISERYTVRNDRPVQPPR